MRFVSLRYFNAAGADPDGEIGECHFPETHLIPLAIQAALDRRHNVTIFGTDFETNDGTAMRDFVHVADLAHAHVLALKYLIAGESSASMNLGTGIGHSVQEVITSVERISQNKLHVVEAPRRPGDPGMLVADSNRARSALGWKPRFVDLDRIVETSWRWHQSQQQIEVAAGTARTNAVIGSALIDAVGARRSSIGRDATNQPNPTRCHEIFPAAGPLGRCFLRKAGIRSDFII